MSITIRKILHFFNKLRDIKKTFEKVTHFTPLHPSLFSSLRTWGTRLTRLKSLRLLDMLRNR